MKNDENIRGDNQKKKEKPSISKNKLKINIKGTEIKENSRFAPSKKFLLDRHQRSNNDEKSDFESLIDFQNQENNIATERHTSSLIENFDQSEFIKNVIIQSNKQGGSRFGSPGQSNLETSQVNPKCSRRGDKSFIKDMKKYGILKAFNDINKFTEFFQNSPSGNQELSEKSKENSKHCISGNLECEYHSSSMQEIAESAQDKNTKSTYLLEELQKEEASAQTKNLKCFKFIFPFQRRARSHSPPKNSVITNKIIETMNNNSPDGILGQSSIHNNLETTN